MELIIQISYDITNTAADQESSFYRTIPSDYTANIGRLVLMAKFEWFRIAIISSNEIYYAQAIYVTYIVLLEHAYTWLWNGLAAYGVFLFHYDLATSTLKCSRQSLRQTLLACISRSCLLKLIALQFSK